MRITTSGESHGKGLFAIVEGFPSGMEVDLSGIDRALARRQQGYGRGGRQNIERDTVEILTGVRGGVTTGAPVTLAVWNRDYENKKKFTAPEGCDRSGFALTALRPGHADLAGMTKYRQEDARDVSERASARNTAARVAAGALCAQLLSRLGITVKGYVRSVGTVCDPAVYPFGEILPKGGLGMCNEALSRRAEEEIDRAREEGDTLGGVFEVRVHGLKAGFGGCMTSAERLDARLAGALMGIQAVKGVEIGLGFECAARKGSEVHDEIFYDEARGYYRKTNRAGGIEGGISNGEELILRAAMKPIPTLAKGLSSVDCRTKEPVRSAPERSDVCAVYACEQIAEAVVAAEIAQAVCERLGGDVLSELQKRYGELE